MKSNLYLVIMAGGSGTRFWPKSTAGKPKQLLAFGKGSKETLLQQTLSRFDGIVPDGRAHRIIVTTERLKSAIEEQAGGAETLAEPSGRNTAPCVYWAAREVHRRDPNGLMLVMPADHYIPGIDSFKRSLLAACAWAETHDDLVTLGVKPTRPETGYGYLKIGSPLGKSGGEDCKKVDAFVEKPKLEKAQEFLKAGNYLWNGGMFLWKAETILKAFDEFSPEMKKVWDANGGDVKKAYPLLPATSVDYAVMEKAKNVVTFAIDCGWDDLGSWTSLESVADIMNSRAECGVVSAGDVVSVEAKGNIVDAPGKLVTLLGVDDLIVVHQGDSILVARKDRAQDLKLIVDQVKAKFPEKS